MEPLGDEMAQREAVRRQLRRAERMDSLARLAGAIAHDLRNHLAVIMANAQFAKLQLSERDCLGRSLDEINDAAVKAAQMTDRLSWFRQAKDPRVEAFDLNDLVRSLEDLLRLILRGKFELALQLDPEVGAVRADRSQIEEVVLSLCVNAREAMPSNGRVVIRTGAPGDLDGEGAELASGEFVALEIIDSGVGIPAELRERIFDPFFTTKPAGGGTGLGLSTSRAMVRELGGDIRVESAVGGGSRFRVLLPREERKPNEGLNRSLVSPGLPTGTETVLVVDDENGIRRVIVRMVAQLGYRPLDAGHSSDALRLSRTRDDINLLLTDVVMPGLSGPELAEALRRDRPDLKVLYMSGYVQDELGEAMALPADAALLEKPFDQSQLALKLREVLERT